jgi:hypothetical protein
MMTMVSMVVHRVSYEPAANSHSINAVASRLKDRSDCVEVAPANEQDTRFSGRRIAVSGEQLVVRRHDDTATSEA